MKNINKIKSTIFVLLLSVLLVSCVDDDFEFGELTSPSNLSVSTEVIGQSEEMPNGDGSGEVVLSASADGATTYKFVFENGSSVTSPSGVYTHPFPETGVYIVTAIAYGAGGSSSSTTTEVEVFVSYDPPQELLDKLIGKEWRIKSSVLGHFGLGPVDGVIPSEWYPAPPEAKAGVGMYDDRYIFNADRTFTHIVDATNDDPEKDPSGTIFGRLGLVDELNYTCSEADECVVDGADVLNIPYQDYTEIWSLSAPGGVETITLTGKGFIGYYIGGDHKYEIWDRSGTNEIHLRSTDGNGEFDWWFILTSEPEGGAQEPEYTLLWEENFDGDALDTDVWNFETGNGVNGWGNQEDQYYTENNVSLQDGNLLITAKAESSNGFDYTSSRITTKDKFEFKFGKVEARAKMPSGVGVWPAIWMLGADIDDVSWPAAGEIDIMEYAGNDPGVIHGSLHYPGNSGGDANTGTTTVADAETEFHVYAVEWTADKISFLVDDVVYHTVDNTSQMPFNKDFFLILNVAMGGTFGGDVDPTFTESSMVVDYVKVFQVEE